METAKLSIVKEDAEDHDTDHEELAEMYGYGQYPQDNGYDEVDSNQVLQTLKVTHKTFNPSRSRIHRYGYIQPISSQILTVFFDLKNSIPFHIELDSGATVSYIREDIVRQYNFKILPNTQVSKLGDVKGKDGTIISVEPWEQNLNMNWPQPQLQEIKKGRITLKNHFPEPIYLGKDVKCCKLRTTEEPSSELPSYYEYKPTLANVKQEVSNLEVFSLANVKSPTAIQLIKEAHVKFQSVFDKDLTQGYNGHFGKHLCRLNWATAE